MAQTGYTPILIYSSSTASNLPSASNLTNSTLGSELAINIADGKLFYKDTSNAVQVIGWKVTPTSAGGTGLTSYTAGDMLYYASGTALSKLAIGLSGAYMSSSGTAPQWTAPAALTKTDDTNVTLTLGGSASTALLNAASLTLGWTGQLSVSRGGTGLSTLTAGYIPYGNGTSAFASGTGLTYGSGVFVAQHTANIGGGGTDGVIGLVRAAGQQVGTMTWVTATDEFQFNNNNGGIYNWRINSANLMRLFASGGLSLGNTTDPGAGKLYANTGLTVGVAPFANVGAFAVKGNASLTDGTAQGTSTDLVQTTSSITTAKTILTSVAPNLSSAAASYIYVYGSNNAGAYFFDVMVCTANAAGVTVLSSTTLGGSPAARTYALSSGALTLAMASGTYNVTARAMAIGYPF